MDLLLGASGSSSEEEDEEEHEHVPAPAFLPPAMDFDDDVHHAGQHPHDQLPAASSSTGGGGLSERFFNIDDLNHHGGGDNLSAARNHNNLVDGFVLDSRLNADERREIRDVLDHLVAEGNFWRHRNWRCLQWKRQREEGTTTMNPGAEGAPAAAALALADIDEADEKEDDSDSSKEERSDGQGDDNNTSRKRKRSEITGEVDAATVAWLDYDQVAWMHAQDARLYQDDRNFGQEPLPWPRIFRSEIIRHTVDRHWDVECGDGLHPAAFTAMRLSQQPCDNNESLPRDFDLVPNPTYSEDAPRTLLLRCWERAMHAAASTIVVGGEQQQRSPGVTPPQPVRTPALAMETCQRMQIQPFHQLETENNKDDDESKQSNDLLACCSCGIERSSRESLEEHFFGNATTNGCCWQLVEQKQRAWVAEILQAETVNQTQQLVRTILSESLERPATNRLLDCFDVLKMVTEKYEPNKVLRNQPVCSNVVDVTLEILFNEPPLHINLSVINAVCSRLVDRYAEVPR